MIFPLPKIDFNKPLYLYGAGMMGISYKRQIDKLGMQSRLKGFVEDQPAMDSYLGVPVIKRSELTEQQLKDSQFLIASQKHLKVLEDNLISQGCCKDNIIHPMDLAWNERSVRKGIKSDIKACIFPAVSSLEDLSLICSRVRKYKKIFSARELDLQVTVVVDNAVSFESSKFAELTLLSSSCSEEFPGEVIGQSDIVLIFNGSSLAALDISVHGKVYFYGLGVLKSFARRAKSYLAFRQPEKHRALVDQIRKKNRIRVVFLAIHHSVWKVDAVFRKMLVNPLFEPVILVCPYVPYGAERMWDDMREACKYFEVKGYPFLSSYNSAEKRWINLEEIGPDIVFFTNPHDLTRKEYYQDAYSKYLSCYVPYHHEVCRYGGDVSQYNQNFHNALWKIFVPHEYSLGTYRAVSAAKGANVVVTGYPATEDLIKKNRLEPYLDAWKTKDNRLRVIWAPHHTIVDAWLPYSNFLRYAEAFKDFSNAMKEKVVWSFKPHPLLKSKLYKHASWGKARTDAYYSYWEDQSHTQLDQGEYTDLFLSSDAMIHDSGSFLAEFLYVEKPVMYLLSENNKDEYYSDFGVAALEACEIGRDFKDVEDFVRRLLDSDLQIKKAHRMFLVKEISPYFDDGVPSERILNEIIKCIS